MKIVMAEELVGTGVISRSIALIQDLHGDIGFPELDQKFEEEFRCQIMYNREKEILGFNWVNESDYSWFLIRCSE